MVALWLAVAVPSVIGLALGPVYDALSRQPHLIKERGELWRLLTAAVVQDGGVAGAAFNLVVLALVAAASAATWGRRWTVALFLTGAVGMNLIATYAFQSAGAGNSGATFFLGTAVAGLLVVRRRSPAVLAAAVGTAVLGAALVVADDAHGVAVLAGLIVGAAVAATPVADAGARTAT